MRKQLVVLAIIVAWASLFTSGCGGAGVSSSSMAPKSAIPTSSVAVFGTDSPLCNVVSFTATITGATLTPQGGGSPVSVISAADSVKVDFAALLGFSAVLKLASVPTGQYSQITVTLSNPQITVLDVTKSPPAPVTLTTTLTSSSVTININPALNVTTAGAAGLALDFNLLKSVETDANGQVTGTVTPVFEANPTSASAEEGLGELDELKGIVQTVTLGQPFIGTTSFTGNFVLQTEGGRTFTVNVNDKTKFEDIAGLSDLKANTFVEVKAFVDSSGNIVAKEVEAEEQEDKDKQKAAFVGLITSVTRDAQGNATQFSLFVREEHPDISNVVPVKSSLTVIISTPTEFKIAAKGTNQANLKFDATTVGVGEHVVVHGQIQSGPPPTLAAQSIFLGLQSIVGNFSSPLLSVGSDGKTGGFNLVPCSSIFQGKPITAVTFGQTAFSGGLTDLNSLTPKPTLLVKGLLFFEPTLNKVGNVALTPPSSVLVSKQVRQLH